MSTIVNPGDMMSQFTREQAIEFPDRAKRAVAYGNYQEPEGNFDAALVLGGRTKFMLSRAKAAAELYHAGRCKLFITTGGVLWDTPYGNLTEAEGIKLFMVDEGVPAECILTETKATTTHENMTFSRVLLADKLGDIRPRVAIVTSYHHVRRGTALAKAYVKDADFFAVKAEYPNDDPSHYLRDPELTERVTKECRCMCSYVNRGLIPDFPVY